MQVIGEGSEEEGGSLWEAGLDPEVPHSMQAGRCRVHRRSASFVRLCDYMLFHALHCMVPTPMPRASFSRFRSMSADLHGSHHEELRTNLFPTPAFKQTWNTQASQGQILAIA